MQTFFCYFLNRLFVWTSFRRFGFGFGFDFDFDFDLFVRKFGSIVVVVVDRAWWKNLFLGVKDFLLEQERMTYRHRIM